MAVLFGIHENSTHFDKRLQEGQHPLTGQRAVNFNFSVCAFHACICFMIYNGSEFAVFRLY